MATPLNAVRTGLLLACLTLLPAGASDAETEPLCEISPRLEILNDALEDYADARDLEPFAACQVGAWRAFGEANWVLTESDMHFVNSVALVPEAAGGSVASVLAGLLALRALRQRTHS